MRLPRRFSSASPASEARVQRPGRAGLARSTRTWRERLAATIKNAIRTFQKRRSRPPRSVTEHVVRAGRFALEQHLALILAPGERVISLT